MMDALGIAAIFAFKGSLSVTSDTCAGFTSIERFPDSFKEIASAEFPKGELFVLSDGTCTCDNGPALERLPGKPETEGLNGSCHPTTGDEQENP